MTQEDKKQLLLQDLCTRLPYGVKLFKVNEPESAFELYSINKESGEIKYYKYRGKSLEIGDMAHLFRTNDIPRFKPYLRTLSSMTEEEKRHISKMMCLGTYGDGVVYDMSYPVYTPYYVMEDCLNYLRSIHVDYSGLIEKGLALEAIEGMYNN